jgi:hypothetical protein
MVIEKPTANSQWPKFYFNVTQKSQKSRMRLLAVGFWPLAIGLLSLSIATSFSRSARDPFGVEH